MGGTGLEPVTPCV